MIFIVLIYAILLILLIFIILGMKPVCPNCGGKIYRNSYDPCVDRVIWKCSRCGEEFI